jgi:N-acetylglucosaminyldiphosphoundecaprenol N-acetyl-beta-D-mannosaminyltransferase
MEEPMTETCEICGLSVSRGSLSALVQKIKGLADHDEGAWILTLNTEMLARGARHSSYWNLLKKADIITADGMPLVWASKIKCPSAAISERTTGVDLVDSLLRLEEVPRFAIIGGKSPLKTVQRYGQRALEACAFVYDGKVDFSEKQIATFLEELTRKRVRMVFIALGVPRQDELAYELRLRMPGLVMLGVGGTFEILGLEGSRAPHWMQRGGLEWLYRLSMEPGRLWRRYLINYPRGIWFLVKDCLVAGR